MKKSISLLILFLGCVTSVWGLDVEVRVAGLIPQDKNIRSVYHSAMYVEYELEASIPLQCIMSCHPTLCHLRNWSDWFAWGNLSYYNKHGRSHGKTISTVDPCVLQGLDAATIGALNNNGVSNRCFEESSEISNWTLNVGLKYIFCREYCFQPYLGFGLGAAYVRFRDHSIYVKQEIHQCGISLLAKSGVEYALMCNLFLDFFADYSFNWLKHCSRDFNTGGFKIGLGLGYRF